MYIYSHNVNKNMFKIIIFTCNESEVNEEDGKGGMSKREGGLGMWFYVLAMRTIYFM